MDIGAVIFDFNGVLVDDEGVHFALFREVLARDGVIISERDYHDRYLGYDDRGCFKAALTDAGQRADDDRLSRLILRKADRYIEVAEQGLRYFPAAAEALHCISLRWPVAICSGALRTEIEYALRQLARVDQVSVIISAEDMVKCKPDPEGYRLALEALRAHNGNGGAQSKSNRERLILELKAANCLVIEDSLAGIQSARAAGMRTVGVPNTYSTNELLGAGADAVISGLATLTPEWIDLQFAS
jgi:beta-phosphoglucomutase